MIIVRKEHKCASGIVIGYIVTENGDKRIEKIIDLNRDGQVRITQRGLCFLEEDDVNGPMPEGLIIFGLCKYDRFTASEVLNEYPEYKKEISELKESA